MVKDVSDRLVLSFGESRPKPSIKLTLSSSASPVVAAYSPQPIPTIRLDQRVVDLCRTFGKDSSNALAIILGHELAHYYRQHEWCSEYAFIMRGTGLGQQLKMVSKDEKLKNESQADALGLHAVYLAGFHSQGLHDRLIDAIYRKFALPDNVPGYPSRQERKQIAHLAEAELSRLYPVHLAANWLLLNGDYALAATCYDHLLQKFPSRELLNNAGVGRLLWVLSKTNKPAMPFLLPIELDGRSRLNTAASRGVLDKSSSEVAIRETLLEARKYFEEAIRKDPAYSPASINLACCYLLSQNYEAAIGRLNEVISQTPASDAARLTRAIAYYLNQQPEKAQRDLQQLTRPNTLSQYNAALMASGHALGNDKAELMNWMDGYWQPHTASSPANALPKTWTPAPATTPAVSTIAFSGGNKIESWAQGENWLLRISRGDERVWLRYESIAVSSPFADGTTIREVLGEPSVHSLQAQQAFWVYPQAVFWLVEGHPRAWYTNTQP